MPDLCWFKPLKSSASVNEEMPEDEEGLTNEPLMS
jgi:hypothetical protein